MKSLTWCVTAASSTVLAAAVLVSAQDAPKNAAQQNQPQPNPQNVQRQPQQPNTRTTTQTQVGVNQADGQLAACLVIDNEGEVAVANFASSKSQNSDVKEFAEMMAKDHQAFIGKLNRFAATTGSSSQINRETTTTTPRDTTTNRDNTTTTKRDNAGNATTTNRDPNPTAVNRDPNLPANRDPNLPANRDTITHTTAFRGTGELDHLRIKREIGQLCVETMKKELSDKKGADFDKCYIGSQIGAHLHMADTLKVLKNYASPELRTVLEEGEKTTGEHLDHARTLMKDLEKDSRKEVTSAKQTD